MPAAFGPANPHNRCFSGITTMSRLGPALIRTFAARGAAVLGSLLLMALVGRWYGPVGVGVLALAQSLLLGLATLARYGLGGALMRYAGRDPDDPHLRRYLRWALHTALVASVVAALGLVLLRTPLTYFFDAPGLDQVLPGIAFALPPFTLAFVLAGLFKGLHRPALASLLENGGIALATVVVLWGLQEWWPGRGLTSLGSAYALAAWGLLILALWPLMGWVRGAADSKAGPVALTPRAFFATGQAFFFTNLAMLMQSVLGVLLAGWLLASAELGLFRAAQQLGTAVSFVLVALNAVFPPRFAALYHRGDLAGLGRLARQGALFGTLLAAPLLILLMLAPEWVLGWLGEGFAGAAPLLRLVALAQLVNVLCGSVGFVLNMSGHEKLMRNISLICATLSLTLFFVLIPGFGAFGAALALAITLVAQNLMAVWYVWRRLGVWTLPLPNPLLALGIKPGEG